MSVRTDKLGFVHFRKLAIDALTTDQRTHLLAQAEHGKWSSARLTKERDKLLGRPDKVPLLTFDGHVEQVYEALPKTASTKLKKALDKAIGDLRHGQGEGSAVRQCGAFVSINFAVGEPHDAEVHAPAAVGPQNLDLGA